MRTAVPILELVTDSKGHATRAASAASDSAAATGRLCECGIARFLAVAVIQTD